PTEAFIDRSHAPYFTGCNWVLTPKKILLRRLGSNSRLEGSVSTVEEKLARLRRFNAWVRRSDAELAEERADLGQAEVLHIPASPQMMERAIEEESIILRRERPVLTIRDNETLLVFVENADSEIWEARLKRAKPLLDHAIRAVGRIELKGSRLDWVGTGWLVADNILVTNRHVANEFAMRKGEGFTFRLG